MSAHLGLVPGWAFCYSDVVERSDYYVYCWTNAINGKQYVGRGRKGRAKAHQQPTCMSPVAHSIRKHGLQAFALAFLETGLTHNAASDRERHYIALLKTRSPAGYNLTDGGEGAEGLRHTTDTKTRLSVIAQTRRPEHQERLNEARRTPEARAASALLGARTRGSKRTEEQRKKQSESHIGLKRSAESIEKTRAGLLGRPKSTEHRKKLAEANTGKIQSPETVARKAASMKLSAAAKRIAKLAHIQSLPAGSERDAFEARWARAEYMRRYTEKKLAALDAKVQSDLELSDK